MKRHAREVQVQATGAHETLPHQATDPKTEVALKLEATDQHPGKVPLGTVAVAA